MLKILSIFFTLFFITLSSETNAGSKSNSEERHSLEAKIDSLVGEHVKLGGPGCAVGVIKDGKFIFKRGYGLANIDEEVPITPETVFDIASMSKQFTAACILLLVQQGKLALDDYVQSYLPELPGHWGPITIRQIIHHTSGLPFMIYQMALAGLKPNMFSEREILDFISRQRSLTYSPGEEFFYVGAGYLLLRFIVKRVTGMSLGEFARREIFEPLGMRNTFYYEEKHSNIKNKATEYMDDGNGKYQAIQSPSFKGLSGNIHTTLEDLLHWDRNFVDNQVGGPNFSSLMETRGILNNGDTLSYAFGLSAGNYRGLKKFSHDGRWGGFLCTMVRFPVQRFTAVILMNYPCYKLLNKLPYDIADLYLTDYLEPVEPKTEPELVEQAPVRIDPAIYADYEGQYEVETPRYVWIWTITNEGDRLMAQPMGSSKFELLPKSETTFVFMEDRQVYFHREDGVVTHFILHQGGLYVRKFKKIKPQLAASLDSSQIKELVGDYYSEELQVAYHVVIKDGQLLVKNPILPVFFSGITGEDPLRQVEGDKFRLGGLNLVFSRDELGKITGFTLISKQHRINLEFSKK